MSYSLHLMHNSAPLSMGFPRQIGGGGLVTKSCPTLETSWTVAYQAPLSLGFCRQQNWSELPFPSPMQITQPQKTKAWLQSILVSHWGKWYETATMKRRVAPPQGTINLLWRKMTTTASNSLKKNKKTNGSP